jgi:5-formyltetrahydrofolate cyclo-ligase
MPDQKAQYRVNLLAARRALPADVAAEGSRAAGTRLAQLPEFRAARSVLLYSARDGEVDPAIVRAAAERQGSAIFYPRTLATGDEIEFVRVTPDTTFVRGRWGIEEPVGAELFAWGDAGLVVVPGVGFDREGTRLGRGKGCYDRAIRRLRPAAHIVGLAFSVQVLAFLPRSDWDQPVDTIVTDAGVLRCQPHATDGAPAPATSK